MSDGVFNSRLAKGIKARKKAQLYVRRRTSQRASNRVLLVMDAAQRYAICVWASYHPGLRDRAVSQEMRKMVNEAFRRRLGSNWEVLVEDAYEAYVKQCAEAGEPNIFEVVRNG